MRISLLILSYIGCIILFWRKIAIPFGERSGFFSEGIQGNADNIPLFLSYILVPLAVLAVFLIINVTKTKYIRCLIYPVSAFLFYFGAGFTFVALTGGIIFLLVLLGFGLYIWVIIAIFVSSLGFDIADFINLFEKKKN